MDQLDALLGRNGLLPHAYCISNSPTLLWTMVVADGLIAAAYFSIPLAIMHFMQQRQDVALRGVALLFSAFIFACGLTHVLDIWTLWFPDYAAQSLAKLGTAGLSIATALALWKLVPQAVQIPTVTRLRGVIAKLEAEMAQRLSAEDQLSELQANLAATLSSIGAAFLATDREGRVTRMNSVAEQLLGWRQDEARGRIAWEVFDREGRPADYLGRNPVEVMMEQGNSVDQGVQVVAIARDGRRTPVEVKSAITQASDGSMRGMALVFRDMTQALRAEAESGRLAAIVESSNDAIIGKTLDGLIISWNRGAEQMFGYTAAEAVGQPIQMLIPAERQSDEMRILTELARGATVAPFHTVRQRRDGRLLEVSLSISPIRNRQGEIVGASKIARDITEQRRAEAALLESERQGAAARLNAQRLETENRHIHAANQLKSQFLANMSHELRTPLNAVIGFADLLRAGAVKPESPKYREYLGHIGTSGRHLLTLINDVLDLSKVESGKFEFYPEPVQLQALLDEVRNVLGASAQLKQITLQAEIEPDLGELMLDPSRLKQVLYNYLSNAIKFTPEGGRVSVRAAREGEHRWRLEVQDTGIGIAAADLPRLFRDFQQLDSGYSKQHQGTGLGLALTRRLVEAQGGSVGVHSVRGQGSTFFFVLDRVQQAAGEESPVELNPVSALPAGRQGLLVMDTFSVVDVLFKPLRTEQVASLLSRFCDRRPEPARVLVIDDDPLALSLMQATLAGLGITAICLADGRQALRELDQIRPDAVVLDLMMPGYDGFAVLEALQGPPRWRELPVYVWTSMLLSDDEADLLRRSARAILHKGGGVLAPLTDGLQRLRNQPLPQSLLP